MRHLLKVKTIILSIIFIFTVNVSVSASDFQIAIEQYKQGKYEEALDTFMRQYYKSSPGPDDAAYEYYIGLTQKQLGNINMAMRFCQ